MARHGILAAWAEALDMTDAAALLRETLAEEKETDLLLNGPATSTLDVRFGGGATSAAADRSRR